MTAPTDREAKIAAALAHLCNCYDDHMIAVRNGYSPEEVERRAERYRRAEAEATTLMREPAPDGKALRELRVWVEGQRDAASSDYKAAGSADERAACNIEIHAYQRVMGQIDRLPSAAPAADAEVEASREATMLRAAIAKIAAAVGAGVDPQCTVEFLCEVPKEVESVVGKLRAENARLQTDLAAARADQAAMAREQLTAVLGEVVANYETRWDRDIEIRWCPQRWLRTYITTRLAALPQPKPAAEPVPQADTDDESGPIVPAALVAYGKSVGLICKKCGYGIRLCLCHNQEKQDGTASESDPEVLRLRPPAGAPAGDQQADRRSGHADGRDAAAERGDQRGPAQTAGGERLLRAGEAVAAEPVPVSAALFARTTRDGLAKWRDAFAMPDETNDDAIRRLTRELSRSAAKQPAADLHAAIQKLADWIGDHWVRKDWGIEGEKLNESMDLLHGIAKLVGFDIEKGSIVKPLPPPAGKPEPPRRGAEIAARMEFGDLDEATQQQTLTAASPPLPIDEGRVRETVEAAGDAVLRRMAWGHDEDPDDLHAAVRELCRRALAGKEKP